MMRRLLLVGAALARHRLRSAPDRRSPAHRFPLEKLPRTVIPSGHRKIVFNWELDDREMSGRGEGAARIASPDSARLDFFLGGVGSLGGAAVLIGDSLRTPGGGDMIRRLVPPPTLLWAALGRVALPNLPDTAIRSTARRCARTSDGRWRGDSAFAEIHSFAPNAWMADG